MEKNKELVIILKNPGTACNIGCTYCAEERKKVVTVEKTITLEDIKKLLDCCDEDTNITMLFHGGEPTILPISYYEEIIEYCMGQRKNIFFGLQTNGVFLTDQWISFIIKHKDHMGLSISLDGTEEMNTYRKDKRGEDTFQRVKETIQKLESNDIRIGMISTLTNKALGNEDTLANLIAEFNNIRFVKLNPCFDLFDTGQIPSWGITPTEYSEFVINFFDIMVRKQLFGKVNVEPILSIMKNIEGIDSSFCNYSEKKCQYFMSLYPDGLITSCDNFNTEEGYLSNLYEINDIHDVIRFQKNKELRQDLSELMEECSKCENLKVCTGGCLAIRRRYKKYYNGDEENIYCRAIDRMINHISNRIAALRRANENDRY